MRWKPHVRFGERAGETDQPKHWHRAPARLHTALAAELPDAVRVLDAFHLTRLGFAAVDDVRRIQRETTGHRGTPATRCSASAGCYAVPTRTPSRWPRRSSGSCSDR